MITSEYPSKAECWAASRRILARELATEPRDEIHLMREIGLDPTNSFTRRAQLRRLLKPIATPCDERKAYAVWFWRAKR